MGINQLITEQNNPETVGISRLETQELVRILNREDQTVALAVERVIPQIAAAIDAASERLARGGRLFYFGAGTSGRLSVVDASECACTYGTPPEMVQALIAGGMEAIADASRGDEDNADAAASALAARGGNEKDVVVGIAASGRTPYVLGALRAGKALGACTIGICNNPESELSRIADITIAAVTGPEAIEGSTRMKAGTAQKMILNQLSTGVMIRLGKVYGNRMVCMRPNNEKLHVRAARIVAAAANCDEARATWLLKQCDDQIQTAIVAAVQNTSVSEAAKTLAANDGNINRVLGESR